MANRSNKVIYVALGADIVVTTSKFAAAILSGSSSMFSEGVHSLVDSANQLLLLYGHWRAARPPDRHRPFGYGRELYFWSFIVSVLIFAGGSGVAIYDGVERIRSPEPIAGFSVSYVVLAIGSVCDGISWWFAFKAFRDIKGDDGYWETVRESKDPSVFLVLFEDSAALVGVVLAAAGLYLSQVTGNHVYDGIASILIGLVLLGTGAVLARESKGLLLGERASPEMVQGILDLVENERRVEGANGAFTVHIRPDQVMAALSLEFADDLCTTQIEESVVELEARIQRKFPEVVALFIKPQTKDQFKRRKSERLGERAEQTDDSLQPI